MEEAGTIEVADGHGTLRHGRADGNAVSMPTFWLLQVFMSVSRPFMNKEQPQIRGCTSHACSVPGSVIAGFVTVRYSITCSRLLQPMSHTVEKADADEVTSRTF